MVKILISALLIILFILLFVLFLLFVLLTVPIRYKIDVNKNEIFDLKCNVSYLFKLINLSIKVKDKDSDIKLRVFLFDLYNNRKVKTKSEKNRNDDIKNISDDREVKDLGREEVKRDNKKADKEISVNTDNKRDSDKTDKKNILEIFLEKIKELIDKASQIYKNLRKIFYFICDDENGELFSKLISKIFCAIKHIYPKKISGKVEFGFEEPSTTGEVLSYISLINNIFFSEVEIIPYFDREVSDINLIVKGRIRIIYILFLILTIVMDRRFFRIIRMYKKFFSNDGGKKCRI